MTFHQQFITTLQIPMPKHLRRKHITQTSLTGYGKITLSILERLFGGSDFRRWLKDVGVDYDVNNPAVYTPVAYIKNGVVTGYHTQYPNVANRFLENGEVNKRNYYPNLYFVQIGTTRIQRKVATIIRGSWICSIGNVTVSYTPIPIPKNSSFSSRTYYPSIDLEPTPLPYYPYGLS